MNTITTGNGSTATRANGWVTVNTQTVSAATGLRRSITVKFRALHVDCCGQGVTFDEHPNNWAFWVDSSYGQVQDRALQCPGCGRMHSQAFRVTDSTEV